MAPFVGMTVKRCPAGVTLVYPQSAQALPRLLRAPQGDTIRAPPQLQGRPLGKRAGGGGWQTLAWQRT